VPVPGPRPAPGPYRRRIRLVALGPDATWGGLEDDFHRFEVTVRHDGRVVTGVEVTSRRWPWSTCPDAARVLDELVGMPLADRCTAVADHLDPRRACTHQFDLAGLAVAAAARRTRRREYDVEVHPTGPDGVAAAVLTRDGTVRHRWRIGAPGGGPRRLLDPAPFTQAPWRGGFIAWADATLPPEDAEEAIVLRRACDIALGRGMDLDALDRADELADLMSGICYTMQPGVAPGAVRHRGQIRDFAARPEALLETDDPRLR
jgi:hypothetical protein